RTGQWWTVVALWSVVLCDVVLWSADRLWSLLEVSPLDRPSEVAASPVCELSELDPVDAAVVSVGAVVCVGALVVTGAVVCELLVDVSADVPAACELLVDVPDDVPADDVPADDVPVVGAPLDDVPVCVSADDVPVDDVPVVDVPVVGSAGCAPAVEVEPEVAPVSVGVELEVPSCPVAGGAPVAPVVVPAPVIVPAPVGVPAVRGVSELVPVWVVPVLGVVVWLLLPVPGLAVLGLPVGIEPSSAPTFPAVCESLPVVGELPRSAVGAAVVCPASPWLAVVVVVASRWLLVAAF
ncbi:MAG: hypothetical protein QOK26_224, partial [Pseudonocardiales bacterium]|nr:hypothetical protein [Pseudonocardiales bacterium]